MTFLLRAARWHNQHRVWITLQDKGDPPVNWLVDLIGPGIRLESLGIVACARIAYLDYVLTAS